MRRHKKIETSVRLIESLKYGRARQGILICLVFIGVLTGVANAAAFLQNADNYETAAGRLEAFGPSGRLTLASSGGGKVDFTVAPDVPVYKDRNLAIVDSLTVGDRLILTYEPLLGGKKRVVEVRANSREVKGKIVSVDRRKSTLTVFDGRTRDLEIQLQTVIMREGSLASMGDLTPGAIVRAEFDDSEPLKLMRLKIDG